MQLQLTVSAPVPRSHAPAIMARALTLLGDQSGAEVTAVWGQRYLGAKLGKTDNVVATITAPPGLSAEEGVKFGDLVNDTFRDYGREAGVNLDMISVAVANVRLANVR